MENILGVKPIQNFKEVDVGILLDHRDRAHQAAANIVNDHSLADEEKCKSLYNYMGLLDVEINVRSRRSSPPQRAPYIAGRKINVPEIRPPNSGCKWRDIFGREPNQIGVEFNSLGEICRVLHEGCVDPRLVELRTMGTDVGAAGAFAVPEALWSGIYDPAIEVSVCMDKVTNFPMTTQTLNIAGWDSSDQVAGPKGSITGSWLGEKTAGTRVTPKLRFIKYAANKLGIYLAASSEILQDAPAIGSSISPLLSNSIAFNIDDAILTGNGVSKPTGILSSGATVSLQRATAGTIALNDVLGMMGRILPMSLSKAVWLCSPSAFATLLTVKIGTTDSQMLLQGSFGGANALPMAIFGTELRVTEKLPTVGTKGDLCLCDLSFYGLAQRETGRFETTNAPQWTSDVLDFRLIHRLDGGPLIGSPYAPKGGGSTLSPFVVLE